MNTDTDFSIALRRRKYRLKNKRIQKRQNKGRIFSRELSRDRFFKYQVPETKESEIYVDAPLQEETFITITRELLDENDVCTLKSIREFISTDANFASLMFSFLAEDQQFLDALDEFDACDMGW